MEAMKAQALELGAQTSFSAGEAAQGMLELAKAGMSAEQSSAAIGGVLNLAAAGGLSVASSAEIAANALNSFGLEASAMPMVADLMAAAANSSSIEIGDMAAAFQMSSAVFASNSQGIDDLSTAIAILGNNGLKGSDAGTSLKTMLMSLTAPTDAAAADMARLGVSVYDAQGNMRAMPSIMADLEKGLSGLTQQQQNAALTTIFGSDAIRAANILLKEGTTGWEEMAASLGEQGAAASVADARMKGLGGAVEYFKGSIESAMIGAALPWTEMLGKMLRWVGDLVSGFGTLSPVIQQVAVVLGAAAAAAGPLLIGLSMMLPALGAIGTVLGVIVSPLGLVVAGIAALVAFDVGGIGTALAGVAETIQTTLGGAVAFAQERWGALQAAFASGDTSWGSLFGELAAQITGIGIETYDTTESIEAFLTALTGSEEATATVVAAIGTIGTALAPVGEALTKAQTAVGEFTASGTWTTASAEISTALGNIGTAISGAFAGDISLSTLRDTLVTEATGIGTALGEVFASEAFTKLSTDLLAAFNLTELPAQITAGVEAVKVAAQPLVDFLTPAFERISTTVSGLGEYFTNIGAQMAPLQEAAASLGTAISGVFAGGEGGSPSVAAMWLQGSLMLLAGAFDLVLNAVNGAAQYRQGWQEAGAVWVYSEGMTDVEVMR
jgi:TP901 family phage tail tape measure protein